MRLKETFDMRSRAARSHNKNCSVNTPETRGRGGTLLPDGTKTRRGTTGRGRTKTRKMEALRDATGCPAQGCIYGWRDDEEEEGDETD